MQITKLIQNHSYSGLVIVLFFALIAVFVNNPNPDLEKRVTDLENRVTLLEKSITSNEIIDTPDTRPDSPEILKWQNRENWRQLRERMRENQVEELLGKPQRIDGGSSARWEYPMGGVVWFRNGRVHRWNEPY